MGIAKINTKKTKEEKRQQEDLHDFYTTTGSADGVKIKFERTMLLDRLMKLGLYRYDIEEGKFEFVRIKDGKIRIVSVTTMRDIFEDFLRQLPDKEVEYTYKAIEDGTQVIKTGKTVITGYRLRKTLLDNLERFFSSANSFLDRLRPGSDIEIMADTRTTKYIFYRNGVMQITKNGHQMVRYEDLHGGCIWESNCLDRDYEDNNGTGDFETFIENVCGRDQDRKNSLMTMIGYLLHNNFDTNLRAVLLTDVNQDDTTGTKAAGGTGKGIIGKAIAHMLNRNWKTDNLYKAIPGKNFDAKKETRYQLADISTQVIHIEDLDEHFDIRDLYNDVTDGATFRKLFQGSSIHMAKFLLSVNHTIRIDSSSDRRRLYLFELANHYNEKFTPIDDFGRMFFSDEWTDRDWNQFDTFMVKCVERYLRYGVEQAEVINYGDRRVKEVFKNRLDFLYFIQDEVQKVLKSPSKRYWRGDTWKAFVEKYPIYNNRKDNIAYTKYIRTYLDLKDIKYVEGRVADDSYFLLETVIDGTQQELDLKES